MLKFEVLSSGNRDSERGKRVLYLLSLSTSLPHAMSCERRVSSKFTSTNRIKCSNHNRTFMLTSGEQKNMRICFQHWCELLPYETTWSKLLTETGEYDRSSSPSSSMMLLSSPTEDVYNRPRRA